MPACSGDLLLEALAACAGVRLGAVAGAIGVEIRHGACRPKGTCFGLTCQRRCDKIYMSGPLNHRSIILSTDIGFIVAYGGQGDALRITAWKLCLSQALLLVPRSVAV